MSTFLSILKAVVQALPLLGRLWPAAKPLTDLPKPIKITPSVWDKPKVK